MAVKLLLDACVWGPAARELRQRGHDVIWAGDWSEDPGDEQILASAQSEGRILITLDKDFGELAVVRGMEHSGIVRLVGFSVRRHAEITDLVIARYRSELQAGSLITVAEDRVRVRPR